MLFHAWGWGNSRVMAIFCTLASVIFEPLMSWYLYDSAVFDFFLFLLYPNSTFTVYSEFLIAHTLRVRAKWLQSCSTLCNPMDCNLRGSSVHGILQQPYWNGLPLPPPGDLPHPGIEPASLTSTYKITDYHGTSFFHLLDLNPERKIKWSSSSFQAGPLFIDCWPV